jgi:hypothetical protein
MQSISSRNVKGLLQQALHTLAQSIANEKVAFGIAEPVVPV